MASKSLGTLTIDLVAKVGGFEQGLSKAERELDKRAKRMNDIAKKVGVGIGTAITAGIAGAVTAAGIATAWTRDVVALGVELEKLSKLANTGTQEFQRWSAGASTVGISQEKLADQLKDFNEKVGEFQETGGGGMKDFFEQIAPKIGITAEAFRGLSGPQGMQLYFDSLEKANLPQERMSFYLESMASDTTALIPLLRDGGRGFREFGDEAERFGAILDSDTIRAIEETRKTSARLDQMMLGLKVTVAEELLPAYNDFTDLLGDPSTQKALADTAQWLGTIAAKAVEFAEKIAVATKGYRDFLANQGALPANMLDTTDQIDERIRKLSGMAYGDDLLDQIRRGIFGDTINEELRKAIAERNAFQWRNVTSGSGTTEGARAVLGTGAGLGVGTGGASKQLSDEDKEAQRLLETYQRLTESFDERIALFGKEGEAAKLRYDIEFGELSKLTPAQKDDLLARAERLDLMDQELELQKKLAEADQRRFDDFSNVMQGIKEETDLVGMSWEQQEIWNNLKWAGVSADSEWGKQIIASTKALQEQREAMEDQIEIMDGARDGAREFFDSMREGEGILKSLEDAFGRFADALFDWATNGIIDGLFGKQGQPAGGSAGGWLSALFGNSGSSQGSIFDLFSGGWGFAGGGTMAPYSVARVNELGMEMATVGGNDYLLTGNKPVEITPHHKLGGGVTSNNNFYLAAPTSKSTQQQIANRTALELQRARMRNG